MKNNSSTSRDGRLNGGRTMPRIQELAEAGAKGRSLSPVEVQQVCEALRMQAEKPARTNFHSGVG